MREEQVAEIRHFIEFLNSGVEEADALSREMLALPSSGWDAWFAAHPAARSVAFFNALLDEAEGGTPAIEVTGFATRHVDGVEVPPVAELVRPFVRGRAWVAHARALRSAEQVDDALLAYVTAAAILRASPPMYTELADVEQETAALRASLGSTVPTPGIVARVEELIQEVISRVEQVPLDALAAAELAGSLADTIPPDESTPVERARSRARALRYRTMPLRYLARYREALAALDRAEEIAGPFDALSYERALIQFHRAITLQEAGRYDESAGALAQCKSALEVHSDARVQLLHRIAEGSLLNRTGRFRDARDAWTALLPVAREVGDAQALASIHNNLAYVLIELGDFAAARKHLDEAIRLFSEMRQPVHALRSELARGRIMIKEGDVEQGIAHLQSVRGRFLGQGLVEEAGLCGLEIVTAQLAGGAAQPAERLARQIVREFTAAHLSTRAITALGFLSDAIAARKASAATAENVRDFIHTLRGDPDAEFRAIA